MRGFTPQEGRKVGISRQIERRERFQQVFEQMPRLEVWTSERPKLTEKEYEKACYDAGEVLEREMKTFGNFHLIPRRIQRDMARKRARRDFRATYGLPEPELKAK